MEKILICYSSQTGNTKKVAEELKRNCSEAVLLPMKEVKDVEQYDLIILGGWIDKGTLNDEALKFVKTIKNKAVAFFFTIGVFPTAKHAYDSVTKIKELLSEGENVIINHFHTQGAIAPKIVNMFLENMKESKYFMSRTLEIFEKGDAVPHQWRDNEKTSN